MKLNIQKRNFVCKCKQGYQGNDFVSCIDLLDGNDIWSNNLLSEVVIQIY